ncbi:MAG TPA: helix-turn-helix domain-containing protein [Candidatus Tumulicola sp.]
MPNFVLDTKVLKGNEKLVLITLLRHDFGKSDNVWPSQVRIAALAGVSRKTVRDSLQRLLTLGAVSEAGRDGRNQVTYRINRADLEQLCQIEALSVSPRPGTIVPDDLEQLCQVTWNNYATKQTKQNKTENKNAPLGGTSPTDATTGGGSRNSIIDNSASLLDAGGEADLERESTSASHSIGNSAGSGASVGDGDLGFGLTSAHTSTDGDHQAPMPKVSTELLLPDGTLASDDFENLQPDIDGLILPMVIGEPLNTGELDRLVGLRGVAFCHMWAHWLPRKIARQYSIGKPVQKPTALYIHAIEAGYPVEPWWPEFDEKLHTVAARAESFKRAEGRARRAGSAVPEYSQEQIDECADAIATGRAELAMYPESLQPKIKDALTHRRLGEIVAEINAGNEVVELPF